MDFPIIEHLNEKSGTSSKSEIVGLEESFLSYLRANTFNRILLYVSILVVLIQFVIFKYIYPDAGFINGDSYSYITSAFYNLRADTYPIGYSKFLRLISVFFYGDFWLVLIQYLSIYVGLLSVVFSLFYFQRPRKVIKVTILILLVPNPIFLYLSNYVSSDSIFLALSFLWFSHLIWILYRPSLKLIISHAIIIFLAFTVRYNALTYPLIATISFFVSKRELRIKYIGVIFSVILIGLFVNYTSLQFKRISGIRQFSPFSGWQLANNAMYAYRFIDSADRKQLPVKFKELDQDVRNYFDTTRDVKKNPQELLYASTVYMWDPISPLRIHMNKKYKPDSTMVELPNWSKVAPLYNEYGSILIKSYPSTFIRYYLWPNFLKFYSPPVEFLENYSTGVDSVPAVAKQWFWYKTNKLTYRTKDLKVNIFNYYPVFFGAINSAFIAMSFAFLFLGGRKAENRLFQLWLIVVVLWTINLGFSVFASPIALRFQIFATSISLSFSLILLDYILNVGEKNDNLSLRKEEHKSVPTGLNKHMSL